MRYQELEIKVIQWAKDKEILQKATPLTQWSKTREELNELWEGLDAQRQGLENFVNEKRKVVVTNEEIIDALGDILVTLIIQAEMQGLKLEDCLESAYNVISKRTGRMENGQFLKDDV